MTRFSTAGDEKQLQWLTYRLAICKQGVLRLLVHHMMRQIVIISAIIGHVTVKHFLGNVVLALLVHLNVEFLFQVVCILLFLVTRDARTPCKLNSEAKLELAPASSEEYLMASTDTWIFSYIAALIIIDCLYIGRVFPQVKLSLRIHQQKEDSPLRRL